MSGPTTIEPDPGIYIIKSKLRGTNITLKGGEGTSLTAWYIWLLWLGQFFLTYFLKGLNQQTRISNGRLPS